MEKEVEKILKALIDEDLMKFKCFDILKEKLINDASFREKIKSGLAEGLISKFPRDLFERVCKQNIRAPFEPIQIFIEGANLGNCTLMSKIIGYSLENIEICGGTLSYLVGTKNSPDGRHTWISKNGIIIDPTLMISIDERFKDELGFNEENRYNPADDPRFLAAKEFANDQSIKK